MRAPLSEDDFDDLEIAVSGGSAADHRAAAEHLLALAKEAHPDDEISTADLLVAAGGQLRFADDPERAIDVLWRAHECGGWDHLDPRAAIVDILLDQDDLAKAEEVSEQVRKSRPLETGTYLYLGELWGDRGETKRALGWLTRGIMLAEREGLARHELSMLCMGRWRIRRREGQEPDEYDEVAMEFKQQLTDHLSG